MRALSLALWLSLSGLRLLLLALSQPRAALRAHLDQRRVVASLLDPPTRRGELRDGGVCVLCFTGTGEVPDAALAAAQRLFDDSPALAKPDLFVIPPPQTPGPYASPRSFSAQMWSAVEDIVLAHPGPFLCIGLSRGALVALDVAMRIASERGKAAGALALSPPLTIPAPLPRVVRTFAAMAPFMERVTTTLGTVPRGLAELVRRLVGAMYLWSAAFISIDLRLGHLDELAHVVRYLRGRDPVAAALVSLREFRLLTEANERDAALFLSDIARAAADFPGFVAACLWGERDHWVDASASQQALRAALRRQLGDAPAAVRSKIVRGQGHGLFRARDADMRSVRAMLGFVLAELSARNDQLLALGNTEGYCATRSGEPGHD